jgi:hypothetical protein
LGFQLQIWVFNSNVVCVNGDYSVPLCAMVKFHRSIRCGPKKIGHREFGKKKLASWDFLLFVVVAAGLFFLAIQNMVKNGVLIVMIILVVFDPTFGRKT